MIFNIRIEMEKCRWGEGGRNGDRERKKEMCGILKECWGGGLQKLKVEKNVEKECFKGIGKQRKCRWWLLKKQKEEQPALTSLPHTVKLFLLIPHRMLTWHQKNPP